MGSYILFSLISALRLVVSHNYSIYLFIFILTSGQSDRMPEAFFLFFFVAPSLPNLPE